MHVELIPRTTSTTSSTKSHNVATFAGAVGGSVGLLSVLALSLAFSLYRRRVRARRRDRAYRESRREQGLSVSSFHTDASDDGPPMQGPAPFVPRYFPGTIINTAPPPYSLPAPASNEPTSALLGAPETPMPSIAWSSRRFGTAGGDTDSQSYAERPPPTPPPSDGAYTDDGYFAPPPSFPVAIATPVPAILAGLSGTLSSPPSPAPRPSSPSSPVIPLLAPPPSSQPIIVSNVPLETPGAGPSSNHPTLSTAAEPVLATRSSMRSIQIHSSEADSDRRSSQESDSLLSPSFAASSATFGLPADHMEVHRDSRAENDRDSIGR